MLCSLHLQTLSKIRFSIAMYFCPYCGESYNDEWLLIAHKEIYHTGEETRRASVIQYAPPTSRSSSIRAAETRPTSTSSSIRPNVTRATSTSTTLHASASTSTSTTLHPSASTSTSIHRALNEPKDNLDTGDPSSSFSSRDNAQILAEAFEGRIVRHYKIQNKDNFNLNKFFSHVKSTVEEVLKTELTRLHFIKFGFVLDTIFSNVQEELSPRSFITKNSQLMESSNIDLEINTCFEELVSKITEHELVGSGWSLFEVKTLNVRVHKHGYGERGSSYIPLPPKIKNTKSCINVQNQTNDCFRYAMLTKFLKNDPHANRPSAKYDEYNCRYNFTGMSYPVSISDIKTFERRNNGVSVNVFGIDESNNVYPLKVVKNELRDHTDLLLLKNGDISHYVYITDFHKLIHRQLSKRTNAITVCKRCFCFTNQQLNRGGKKWLIEHALFCKDNPPVRTLIPHPSRAFIKFNKVAHQYPVPIVIYADFEASLVPRDSPTVDITSRYKYQSHQPNSYSIILQSTLSERDLQNYGLTSQIKVYRGEDAATKFIDDLYDIANKVERMYSNIIPMKALSNDELLRHQTATTCYLCNCDFVLGNHKVRDHDHLTGNYRGPACNNCNINYKLPRFIPVILHNLSGYDSHFIIPQLGRDNGAIDVLATTSEKFISFSKKVNKIKLRFIDSFRFMPLSLSTLAKNLSQDKLYTTKKIVPTDKLPLVLRKGVFPYEYIDSMKRFDETKLPPRESFYSNLTESHISEEDYQHACTVWSELNMKTLGEYNDFYVTLDVTLLCDVMEEFRKTCLASYGLDPLHSYTSPGLSWQAMLKKTKCVLELLTDIDMILMIESGVRGGLTQCVKRYVKANNKYLPDYDKDQKSNYLIYLDANNLYGQGMGYELGYGDFKWVNPKDIDDIRKIPKHGNKGYILDFDFEYPDCLHDHHYDFPLLPRTMIPPEGKYPKLMMTLDGKCRYIAHFWSVQQALDLGIRITKIHRILEFSQSTWLKSYIDTNTQKRASATTSFEKDFFKLMNNSIFGKTLENQRRHKNVKLVTNAASLMKLVQKPNFQTSIIINENLVAVSMEKTVVKMQRPLYVGMSILDISKTIMYDFHYNKMLAYYGRNNISIVYQDTDSFLYNIETEDLYEDFRVFPYRNDFDFSEYPPSHPTFDFNVNKKVLGKFKDETKSVPISEVVALMSKLYAIKLLAPTDSKHSYIEKKRAKGVKSRYVENEIKFEDYKKCLFEKKTYIGQFNTIRSFNHKLFSISEAKTSLSSRDDKRKTLEDGINTLPYGHYLLRRIED